MTTINRRGLLLGLASALAAPAIVHAGNLMPVKAIQLPATSLWIVKGWDAAGNMIEETISGTKESWANIYGGARFKRVGDILFTNGADTLNWSKEIVHLEDKLEAAEVYSPNSDLWYTPRA